MGEGFLYYLGPNSACYPSRGVTVPIFEIPARLLTHKARPCEYKVEHSFIAPPQVLPREGTQSLGEGFIDYLSPKSTYYPSRWSVSEKMWF